MHWTGCNQKTLGKALKNIENAGIIVRNHRFMRSTVYQFNTAVLEGHRESFRKRTNEQRSEPSEQDFIPGRSFEVDDEDDCACNSVYERVETET